MRRKAAAAGQKTAAGDGTKKTGQVSGLGRTAGAAALLGKVSRMGTVQSKWKRRRKRFDRAVSLLGTGIRLWNAFDPQGKIRK